MVYYTGIQNCIMKSVRKKEKYEDLAEAEANREQITGPEISTQWVENRRQITGSEISTQWVENR